MTDTALDLEWVRQYSPLNGLREDSLKQVHSRIAAKKLGKNEYLFKHGSRDDRAYFLVSGMLELFDKEEKLIRSMTGGAQDCMHRVAHQVPRLVSARAKGEVTYFEVDNNLLDVMLTWDQTGSFEVSELQDKNDPGGQPEGDWMSALLQIDLFQRIPPANLQALFMKMERIEVNTGDTVVEQDAEGDYFYVMTAGRALVTRQSGAHTKPVRLAELGAGSCFGEEALISNAKRNATIEMLSSGVLLRLDKEDFNSLLTDSITQFVSQEDVQSDVESGKSLWLDVRLPSEFKQGHIENALNIPLILLRARLASLDNQIRYVCYCDSERRSSVAAFVLRQNGLQAAVLKGGFTAVGSN